MRINTLLKIFVSAAILMVLGLAAVNWYVTTRLAELSRSLEQTQNTAHDISDLLVLTHEFALYSEDRPAQQWMSQHAAIIKSLESRTGDTVPVPPETVAEAKQMSDIFQQLVASKSAESTLQARQQNLLLNQLQASVHTLSDSIHHWSSSILELRQKTERAFRLLAITIPTFLLLLLSFLAILLQRRVLRPLAHLLKAVRATAHGDVSVRTATGTDDEFGELSRTFDTMAIDMVAGLKQEISERKRAEEALQESEKKYRDLIENVPALFYKYSTKHGGLFYSPQVEQTLGYPLQAFYDNPQLWNESIHPEDIPAVENAIGKTYENGNQGFDIEYRVRTGSGEWLWLRDSSFHHVESNGEMIIHGIALNISDIKQTEAEKEKLEDQLIQAQKMESVGRLAGGVAHDFNNMLTIIHGYSNLSLMELDTTSPLRSFIEGIQKAAERSADLTRQLLAFARKQTIAPKVLNLNETVSGTLKMLHRLIGENITLAWRPSPDLWQLKLDPSQIDQILANLCVNARDAIADIGTITIETGNCVIDAEYTSRHAEVVPGEYVKLIVSDTGSGMDTETASHIFEPFFTTKETGKGTGLGLATVFGIVKQNNGFINVYSEPDTGTSFSIYLPRHVSTDELTRKESASTPVPRGHETILLVEDEPAILNITSMLLEKSGYTVRKASTPSEAIRHVEESITPINLLITDVIMPEINGRDLAETLTALNPHIKCLYMSGYTADAISQHGVLDEGVRFIQKPFTLTDLAVKVRETLDAR